MKKNIFKYCVSSISTGLTWLVGGWDVALIVLVTFMALDYITGVLTGYITQTLSSNVGLKGLARKSVIFIVLIMAVCLDKVALGSKPLFRTLVAYFYIANEGLSILENSVNLGLPIPNKLKEALFQLKEGHKKDKEVK